MNQFYQSAFLKALGWSLIDSLWQMGLMWLLYLALTANGKRYQSHQRHTIALLSLAGGSLWFLISLVMNFYEAAAAPVVINMYASVIEPVMNDGFFGNLSRSIESALPFLSVGYLLAAAWLFVRFYYRYHQTRQLLKAEMVKAAPELRVFLQTAAARMGIKKESNTLAFRCRRGSHDNGFLETSDPSSHRHRKSPQHAANRSDPAA